MVGRMTDPQIAGIDEESGRGDGNEGAAAKRSVGSLYGVKWS